MRLTFSDESKCVFGVAADDVENLIAQIETALADDQPFFTAPTGRRFVCEIAALRQIKTLLCSIRGGSDAHVLGSRANAQSKGATRTVRDAKKDSEASASKVSASATRQFNNHPKSGRRANAGSKSPAAAAVPISSGVRDSRRKSRAVRCNPCETSILTKIEKRITENSSFPRVKTKNGRTSVIVATRKVS